MPKRTRRSSVRTKRPVTASKTFTENSTRSGTVADNLEAGDDSKSERGAEMTLRQATEKLITLIGESDPDTSLTQVEHLLQSGEAIRRDGKAWWFQLTGLVHCLLLFVDAQCHWDVGNPGYNNPIHSTKNGIYSPGYGKDNIMLRWGYDEDPYSIVEDQSTLPDEALAMIWYHSFYPWHLAGAHHKFMDEHDIEMLDAIRTFNP